MGCENSRDQLLDKDQAAKFLGVTKDAFNATASRYKFATIIKHKKAYYRTSVLRYHRDRNQIAK
jgi:hypothetical protein